jgi:ABC-type branched-subunit amino acid transport system substrate-binding protein
VTTHVKDVYKDPPLPIKIGILMDIPERHYQYAFRSYDLVKEQFEEGRRFERPVEFVIKNTAGAPSAYITDVISAFHELCDAGCLVIVGPNHSDNNLALAPIADERRVPTIMMGATAENLREWVFSIPWASIPEDAYLIASWLKSHGHRAVTMTWDSSWHGEEYVAYFRRAASKAGIDILCDKRFSVVSSDEREAIMRRTVEQHRRLNPDAIVHFGTGNSNVPWAHIVREEGWDDIPRIQNGGFYQVNFPYSHWALEGWVGVSMWDDDNETLKAFHEAYKQRYPDDDVIAVTPEPIAVWRDAMSAALEGLVLAPIFTTEGVKEGLERIRGLPAAVGGARQIISFGKWDRRGHKGADTVVLRRLRNGQSVMEGRFAPI